MFSIARSMLIGLASLIPAPVWAAPQAESKGKDGVDALGDPLPEGALMRFGSNRLRHGQAISTAAFSPDGKRVASAGFDGHIRIWNTADGREVADLPLVPPANVALLRFSPNGARIAAASNNLFTVFDVATAKPLWRENQNVLGIGWSSDGKHLAAARSDSVVRIVDAQTGKLEGECVRQNNQLTAVAFAANDKEVLAAAADYTVRRFDVATGKLLRSIPFPKLIARNRTIVHPRLTFSPDGSHLALCDSTNGFWFWPVEGEARLLTDKEVSVSSISASISLDNRFIAIGNADGSVSIWGVESGKVLRSFYGSRYQFSAVLSPDARRLATFSNAERHLRVFNLDDYQPIGPPAPPGDVFTAVLIDDGKTVVTGANQGHLIAWDVATGKIKDRFDNNLVGFLAVGSPGGKTVRAIDFQQRSVVWEPGKKSETRARTAPVIQLGYPNTYAANGEWLAMRAPNGEISLRESESGREIKTLRPENRNVGYQLLRMSPDTRWLTAIDNVRMAWTWEVTDGRLLPAFGPLPIVAPLAFSPDGRLLLAIEPSAFLLWETSSGRVRARVPRAPNTPYIASLAVSRDHRLLFAGNGQGELMLYDVLEKNEVRRIAAHKGPINHIIFPPSGNRFLTVGGDGTVLAWDADQLAARLPVKPLPAENVREWMTDLSSLDGEKAAASVRLLAAHPDATMKLLRTLAKPPADETVKRIADLIQQLDHPRFKVREDATKELGRYGVEAKKALEDAVKKAPSEDARVRMENLLKRIQGGAVSAESLRELRLIEVLERIGMNEARELVAAMSKADIPAAREAKAVLERWRKE